MRDHLGQLCVARAVHLPSVQSPLETELLAIKEALLWCRNSSYDRGMPITDSKNAVDLINSDSMFLGPECPCRGVEIVVQKQPWIMLYF